MAVNASTIRRVEVLWETCSFGDVGVGHFEVDGKLAFCMEHAKATPSTGTDASATVYDNAAVQKVLYYGYTGPAQWSGFTSAKNGIMVTSLMLSEVYTSAHAVGTYDEIPGLAAFRNFLASQPAPDLDLRFDKKSVKAYYDKSIDAERTEMITVLGTGTGKLTVNVPEGYILRRSGSTEEFRGSVVLAPGDKFYLRTEGAYSERKSTDIKGRNAKLKPLVFVTDSSSLQDLTRLEIAEDSAETTVLHVDWIGKINLRINKRDLDTGEAVNGAEFKIYEYDRNGRLVLDSQPIEYTIEKDGTIFIAERLQCGRRYVIQETKAPYCYRLNEESQSFEVRGDTPTISVDFANEKQYVYLIINKTGITYDIDGGRVAEDEVPLEGVKFEVMASNKILKWGTKEVMYYPGDTICELVTDVNGYASTEGLPYGKYTLSEVSTVSGYVVDREAKTYDLRVEPTKKEFRYTVNLKNKPESSEVKVVKYDEQTGKKLEGAHFEITNEEGASLEVCTEKNGETVINNLPVGNYTFQEVKAPKGYAVDHSVKEFTIGEAEDEKSVTLKSFDNRLDSVSTGDNNHLELYVLISVLALVLLALTLTIKRRCDRLKS